MNSIAQVDERRQMAITERVMSILCVIPFCEPSGLTRLLGIEWSYLVLLDSIILLFISILVLRRAHKLYFIMGSFYITILVSTFLNGGEAYIAICYAAKMICFIVLVNMYAKLGKLRILFSTFKMVLGTIILITLFMQLYNQDAYGLTSSHNHYNFLTPDNDLGYWYLPFILIVYLADAGKSRRFQMVDLTFWGLICLFSLVKAWAATCLAVYVIFIVFVLLRRMKIFQLLTPTFSIVTNMGISVAVIFFQIQRWFGWLIEDVLHKDMTLSFRTYVWSSAIQNIMKKPILGYGTAAGGKMSINSINAFRRGAVYFSHNLFLEILIQGGIIALVFYILMHLLAGRELRLYKQKTEILAVIKIALFCILLMQFSEFALYEPFANLPLILCFFYKDLLQEGFARDSMDGMCILRRKDGV